MSNHESNVRALQIAPETPPDLPREDTSSAALILSGDAMERAIKFAELMSTGRTTVPSHLQKNPGDCLAVTLQAMQWRMNPFAVAQKTHLVNGTLGYEGQLVNAVLTTSGAIVGRPNYEWFGEWKGVQGKSCKSDDIGIIVSATVKGESAPRSLRVSMAQVGVRNSPLWEQDPRQQIGYLAIKRWSRLHTPDVMLGVYTPDELEELPPPRNMGAAEVITPEPSAALLNEARAAANKGVAAYQAFWAATSKDNRKLLAGEHESLKSAAIRADKDRTIDNGAPTQPATQNSSAPAVTFAEVMSSMKSAADSRDIDALNAAADMIRSVANEDQRKELSVEYRAFVEDVEGSAQ